MTGDKFSVVKSHGVTRLCALHLPRLLEKTKKTLPKPSPPPPRVTERKKGWVQVILEEDFMHWTVYRTLPGQAANYILPGVSDASMLYHKSPSRFRRNLPTPGRAGALASLYLYPYQCIAENLFQKLPSERSTGLAQLIGYPN